MQKGLILLIFVNVCAYSQNPYLDSLKKVWRNKDLADTIRLEATYQIVKQSNLSNQPDSALFYAALHYELAEKKGLKGQMSRILNIQGISASDKGKYTDALNFYARSLKIAEDTGDKKRIGSLLNNIGRVNEKQGNYEVAQKYFLRCLAIFQEIGEQRGSLITMNNIATIHLHQGNYVQAVEFYTSSLKIAEERDEKDIILNLLNNIGLVYKQQGDFTKALEYYSRSLENAREINDKAGIALVLNNIGSVHEDQGDDETAIDYYIQGLKIREQIGDQSGLVSSYINISSIYHDLKDYSKALEYQTHGLNLAEKIGYKRGIAFSLRSMGATYLHWGKVPESVTSSLQALSISQELGLVEEIKSSAETLHMAYDQMGNHAQSLKMYKLYIHMRDSIQNIDTQKEVIRQEFKYNYEKQALADSIAFARQRELDTFALETKQEKERYALVILFTSLLIFVIVFFRIRFIKNLAEREKLLQEIRLLKVKTSVNLASLISTDEQPQLDKKKIESTINTSLNQSDWDILNALYNNPAIGNKEIAETVFLSVEGVRSSLKKMYRFFNIEKSANQRVLLVIEAAKLSHPVVSQV